VEAGDNYSADYRRNEDTVHSNQQRQFTLVARLIKGQKADGSALASAFFARLGVEVMK
jgi:putative hemolysin